MLLLELLPFQGVLLLGLLGLQGVLLLELLPFTFALPFGQLLCPRLAQVFEDGGYLAGREILATILVA